MSRTHELEEMDVQTWSNMTASQKEAWCRKHLTPIEQRIREVAETEKIPPQLLATVIMNELNDINSADITQQNWGAGGSLGIAQIQVSTALSHGLLDFPGDDDLIDRRAREQYRYRLQNSRQGIVATSLEDFRRRERWQLVRDRLTRPNMAVLAAGREIRRLIERMTQHRSNPWQAKFSFSLTDAALLRHTNDIYDYVDGTSQIEKEMNLAEMVVAAYNSPDIVIAQNQASITAGHEHFIYRNATIHGTNARSVAWRLYTFGMFR
jgi:hypothetical protein